MQATATAALEKERRNRLAMVKQQFTKDNLFGVSSLQRSFCYKKYQQAGFSSATFIFIPSRVRLEHSEFKSYFW